jgi:hypothetical protein
MHQALQEIAGLFLLGTQNTKKPAKFMAGFLKIYN